MIPPPARAALFGVALGAAVIGLRAATGISAAVVILAFLATVAVPVWFELPLPGGPLRTDQHDDDPREN